MFIDSPLENRKIEFCYLDNTYFNEQYARVPTRNEAFEGYFMNVFSFLIANWCPVIKQANS